MNIVILDLVTTQKMYLKNRASLKRTSSDSMHAFLLSKIIVAACIYNNFDIITLVGR